EGVYREPLVPAASGTPAEPITFRNSGGEPVTITGVDAPAIQLIGRGHIIVQGLIVSDVLGWGRLQDSHDILIRSMTFRNATAGGTTGGLKLVRSWFNRILDSRFEDANDSIVIQDSSDGNVVAGSVFVLGHHSLISIRCSNGNIIRGNSFSNERQKALEIYDCEGVSDAPVQLDATRRNLVENNRFILTRGTYKPGRFDAIQHSGQYTIVRRNVFSHTLGGGVVFAYYEKEALFVYGNRLYNNTFYENRCFAITGGGVDD